MKQFFLIAGAALLTTFGAAAAAQNVDTSKPEQMIQTITSDVMHTVQTDPTLRSGDVGRITELVHQKILPYADFARTTQLAMGPAWRHASPEQRQQLIEQFETLLIRTYAGAVSEIRNQQVIYKPFRASPNDTDVVVRTEVINQGQPIQIDYRLEKTPAGWRVYDLNVLGAWLIAAYQQQFSQVINQQGVDGLIRFLTQRNQQLAAGQPARQ